VSTAKQLIQQARRELLAGIVEERNRLAQPVALSDTSITLVSSLNGLKPGAMIEVGTEIMYVHDVDESAKVAYVDRGEWGSGKGAHDEDAVVTIRPRFPMVALLDHLNDELVSLSGEGLFAMRALDVEFTAGDRAVDLAGVTRFISVYEVRAKRTDTDWPLIRRWRVASLQNPGSFPTGRALILDQDVGTRTLRVLYRSEFSPVSDWDADVPLVSGIPDSAQDIVRMGIQIRAMSGREAKRTFLESQGDTRRPDEVREGASINSWRGLVALRQQRIAVEAAKLNAKYPQMIRKV
jgi:hypothetical protein